MTDAYLPPAGGVRFSQIAPAREVRYHAANARAFTVRELADAYMASYRGRESVTRLQPGPMVRTHR